jgi:hypothetical protein
MKVFEKREDYSDYSSFKNDAKEYSIRWDHKVGDTITVHWFYIENASKYRLGRFEFGPIIKSKTHEKILTGIFVYESGSEIYIKCGKKLICFELRHHNMKLHYSSSRNVLFEKAPFLHNQRRVDHLGPGMADEHYSMGGVYYRKQ